MDDHAGRVDDRRQSRRLQRQDRGHDARLNGHSPKDLAAKQCAANEVQFTARGSGQRIVGKTAAP